MHHLYLLPFISDAQYRGGVVLDNQLAFLQGGDSGFQVVEFLARYTEQVANHHVGDAQLLLGEGKTHRLQSFYAVV